MSREEQKTRKKKLLAWVMVFSVLTGSFWFGRMETDAATETGAVLTVEYQVGNSTVTQTYPQHYIDEAAGTKEESVTITMAAESEISIPEGQIFTAWQMTEPVGGDSITLLPGEEYTFSWADLISGESSAVTVYVQAVTREFHIANIFYSYDGGSYYITNMDSIGGISIDRQESGYTVYAPGLPKMDAHRFERWICLNSDRMPMGYAEAGGVFQTEDGAECMFSYDEWDYLVIEAEWTAYATVNYYENESDYIANYVTMFDTYPLEFDDNGYELPLSFQVGGMPSGTKTFLGWKENVNNTHVLEGMRLNYSDWYSLSSGYVVSLVGTWLTPAFEHGDVNVSGYNGAITVDTFEDYFYLYAPEAEPEADGYFFDGWSVLLGNTAYEAESGMAVCGSDGKELELLYENYEDATVTFTSNWKEPEWAVAWFDSNGGWTESGSTEPETEYFYQSAPEDTGYVVTMPQAPERDGYKFAGWQYTKEDGTEYLFEAGESTAGKLEFLYETNQEVIFTAKWIDLAEIIYLSDANSAPVKTVRYERREGENRLLLDLESGKVVSDTISGDFLVWQSEFFENMYALPGTSVTLDWDAIAGTTVYIIPKWLRGSYDMGEPDTVNFDGAFSVSPQENTFTVTAPQAPKAFGYLFRGWTARFETDDALYYADAGAWLENESGESAQFEYGMHADQTVTFEAQWEKAPVVTVNFYELPDEYTNGIPTWADTYVQEDGTDTFTLVVPRTAPEWSGYRFSHWNLMLSEGESIQIFPGEKREFSYAEYGNTELTVIAEWKENNYTTMDPIFIVAGEMELVENQKYCFPEGNWKLEGDDTIYRGGMEFFIMYTGTFVITEVE